jgi:hypothetical protein
MAPSIRSPALSTRSPGICGTSLSYHRIPNTTQCYDDARRCQVVRNELTAPYCKAKPQRVFIQEGHLQYKSPSFWSSILRLTVVRDVADRSRFSMCFLSGSFAGQLCTFASNNVHLASSSQLLVSQRSNWRAGYKATKAPASANRQWG